MGKNRSIAAILMECGIAIRNAATDPQMRRDLAPFGYDDARFREGLDLLETTTELCNRQEKEFADRLGATYQINDQFESAKDLLADALDIARIAFKRDAKTRKTLGLDQARRESYDGWIGQAELFYGNLLGDKKLLEAMAAFGYGRDRLLQGADAVKALRARINEREKEAAEALEATRERDARLQALIDWRSNLIIVARIALKDRPQLLEKLGVTVPS